MRRRKLATFDPDFPWCVGGNDNNYGGSAYPLQILSTGVVVVVVVGVAVVIGVVGVRKERVNDKKVRRRQRWRKPGIETGVFTV